MMVKTIMTMIFLLVKNRKASCYRKGNNHGKSITVFNIIYNGMSLQNNRRVRRSIILPGIAKYRTDILRQCLVKCVSEF